VIVFSKNSEKIKVNIAEQDIESKSTIKVLGVIFDEKLNWTEHINDVIKAVKRTCFGIQVLRKFLNENELLGLVTTLGHSKLYYGGPVWLSRNLHQINLRKLLRTSACLIRSCFNTGDWSLVSFEDIHTLAGKPTPLMMSDYLQATTLKNIIVTQKPDLIWLKLQQNSRYNQRTNKLTFGREDYGPWSLSNLANRVQHVSQLLPSNWEIMSKETFKRAVKNIFFV